MGVLTEKLVCMVIAGTGAGVTDVPGIGDTAAGDVMPFPLLAAGIGGLALSGSSNLYSQYKSRQLYRRQINAYSTLQKGYERYLARNGLKPNRARMYAGYYGGKIDSASTNLGNSYIGSLGTAGGTFGAGVMLSRKWL